MQRKAAKIKAQDLSSLTSREKEQQSMSLKAGKIYTWKSLTANHTRFASMLPSRTVWLIKINRLMSEITKNIGPRHISMLPVTSRTGIHTVLLPTFSWSGTVATAMVEVHSRDQMTLSRGSMRGLVPFLEITQSNESFCSHKNRGTLLGARPTQELLITRELL